MKPPSDPPPVFDVKTVRDEVRRRWHDPRYREQCIQQLQELGGTPVPGGPPGMTVTRLEMLALDVVDEIKDNFDANPWHGTLKLVTYDLPIKAAQVVEWIEALVDGKENEGAPERIMRNVPGMRDHPETATYMQQMILPFRSVVVSQLCAAMMDAAMGRDDAADNAADSATRAKRQTSSKGSAGKPRRGDGKVKFSLNEKNSDEDDGQMEEKKPKTGQSAKQKHSKLFPAHVHAAHHAQDISDVFVILSFVPKHVAELRAHIAEQKRLGHCTRFAEYHLFYMTSPDDATDAQWIDALTPFAKAGLAHAQFDVAQCCLTLRREHEALAWLERASKIGHSKAMLTLSRLHITKAFAAVKYAQEGGAQRVKRTTDDNTRAALKWLDALTDADWDDETPADIAEGKKLIEFLEREATAVERNNKSRNAEARAAALRRFLLWFFAAVVAALALWYAASAPRQPRVPLQPVDDGPTHVNRFVKKN